MQDYARWEDEPQAAMHALVSVRVRRTRPDDDSPRARHPILAYVLRQWGAWRNARWAATWGLPGDVAVDWHQAHVVNGDAEDLIRLGGETIRKDPYFRSVPLGFYAVDVWNGRYVTTFTPRLHY